MGSDRLISRDLSGATGREYDLAVIGGGIYGASLLREAARSGLSTCLCEAGDFGGGTSWNSLRIVHGGLRYLQTLDLPRFRQSVVARRRIARQFPTLVRPLECLMPLYGKGLKRPSAARLALLANDALSAARNRRVAESVRLGSSGVLDAEETRRRFPSVRRQGLKGAARWNDYVMVSSERILIELLRDACRHGAVALNYTAAIELLSQARAVRGVRVRDSLTGDLHTISAKAVVNCAGPRVRALALGQGGGTESLFYPSLAFNVLLDATLPGATALAVAPPQTGAPLLFVVPQGATLLAGTMHLARPANIAQAQPTHPELDEFLALLNQALPDLHLTRRNVLRVFAGLLPVTAPGSTDLLKREILVDHGKIGGAKGFYSVSGVKFTTANEVARRLLSFIGAPPGVSDGEAVPLADSTGLLTEVGRLWEDPVVVGEALTRTVREEAVHCLDDLILRRSNWAATGADLEQVRDRVTEFVKLPATVTQVADLAVVES